MKAVRRLLVLGLIIAVSVGVGFLARSEGVARVTGLEGLELLGLEYRQRAVRESFRTGERESEVVLVLFDSSAVKEWPYLAPFPRNHLADLIEALDGAGARTIGLDVYLEDLYPELNRMDAGDDRLREAMAAAGNVIVVAPTVATDSGRVLESPHPSFAEVAAGVAAADLPTPFETVQDGLLTVRTRDGELEPGFALALWMHYTGRDPDSLLATARKTGRLPVEGLPDEVARLPEGWAGGDGEAGSGGFAHTFPLRFYGPRSNPESSSDAEGTFRAFSSSTVPVMATFAPESFRDRIVILGTGFHDSDKFRTPFYYMPLPASDDPSTAGGGEQSLYGWMFGPEIHANAVQNLLDRRFIQRLGPFWTFLLLALVTGLTAAAVFWNGALWGAGGGILAMGGVVAVAFWSFAGSVFLPGVSLDVGAGLIWVPVVAPVVAVVFSYLASTAYVAFVEGREKRFIRSAFGKYVPPAVVAQISDRPDALKLGGQKRPLSIFFSDLAGFTTLSERMSPEELIALLNEYLHEMTEIVMGEEGTLDKYIGDAIMAFWNAPKSQPDHADRALRCAVRTQQKMDELNRKWAEEGRTTEEFVVRVGVNTGDVVVGNVGGEERFDYSAVGDAVNLAARLEPANKTYHTKTMTSEFTLEQVRRDAYRFRELDVVAVKGKTRPVKVYEVLGFSDKTFSPEMEEALELYDKGMAAFRGRDWVLAARYFDAALESYPLDGPSKVYLKRAETFISDPPPAGWDFVVRRTVK